MLRRLTHHPDGHKLPPVEVKLETSGVSVPGWTLIVQLPGGWCFFVDFAFHIDRHRFKLLADSDIVIYNEPIAADDWRDQPTRRDGSDW